MKPELIKFVAGTKAKASEVNENFEKVLNYAETASAIVSFDIETEYKFGQWVLGEVEGKSGIYESLVEENRGHLLSDETYWKYIFDTDIMSDLEEELISLTQNVGLPTFSTNSGNTDENGNADLLYLPSMGTQQVSFQLDGTTTIRGYHTNNSDTSQIKFGYWYNDAGSGVSSSTAKHIFAMPKTTPIAFTIEENCATNGRYSNATLTLTFDDNSTEVISLGTITNSTAPFEVGYSESGKSVVSIEFYGLWTFPSDQNNGAGVIIKPKYETITISTSTSCYFKVGGNYPNLIATSTEKTFEKSYLEPITVEADRTYNVFISEAVNPYALASTIYRQKTEPTANTNDVWLNTSVQPYKAYKYNGSEWEEFLDVPIGSMVVSGGIITSVETFEYNLTLKKVTSNMPSSKYIDLEIGANYTNYTAPADGWLQICVEISGNGLSTGNFFAVEGWTKTIGTLWQCGIIYNHSNTFAGMIPLTKGEVFSIKYANPPTNQSWQVFRFYYAEDEV